MLKGNIWTAKKCALSLHHLTTKTEKMIRFIIACLIKFFLPILVIGLFWAFVDGCTVQVALKEMFNTQPSAAFCSLWGAIVIVVQICSLDWD